MGTRALVLSGGGMFGAWQAGAWQALSEWFEPDLIVGASVGSMNGYAIASGWSPQELCEFWLRADAVGFAHLEQTARLLASKPLQKRYAVVLVDLLRMKPRTYEGGSVTWEHLFASCAVPGVVLPRKLDGRWFLDGGLLNPLPVWAAVDLGATEIVALNALPEIPSAVLKPFVKGFRALFGYRPPLPKGVQLTTLRPGGDLGDMRAAIQWNAGNAARWIAQGRAEAGNISIRNCFRG